MPKERVRPKPNKEVMLHALMKSIKDLITEKNTLLFWEWLETQSFTDIYKLVKREYEYAYNTFLESGHEMEAILFGLSKTIVYFMQSCMEINSAMTLEQLVYCIGIFNKKQFANFYERNEIEVVEDEDVEGAI
jgi:hypothetical protein